MLMKHLFVLLAFVLLGTTTAGKSASDTGGKGGGQNKGPGSSNGSRGADPVAGGDGSFALASSFRVMAAHADSGVLEASSSGGNGASSSGGNAGHDLGNVAGVVITGVQRRRAGVVITGGDLATLFPEPTALASNNRHGKGLRSGPGRWRWLYVTEVLPDCCCTADMECPYKSPGGMSEPTGGMSVPTWIRVWCPTGGNGGGQNSGAGGNESSGAEPVEGGNGNRSCNFALASAFRLLAAHCEVGVLEASSYGGNGASSSGGNAGNEAGIVAGLYITGVQRRRAGVVITSGDLATLFPQPTALASNNRHGKGLASNNPLPTLCPQVAVPPSGPGRWRWLRVTEVLPSHGCICSYMGTNCAEGECECGACGISVPTWMRVWCPTGTGWHPSDNRHG